MRFRDGQTFSMRVRVRNFPDPPESAQVGIFARDYFLSLSFGLIMLPVRFRAIP